MTDDTALLATPIADSPVLATTLALAVPLHIHDLRALPPDRLAAIASRCATIVGSHGDDLQYGGPRCADAFNALARGLACAALTAWGGITIAGLHWCQTPSCPGPDAPHDLPDGTVPAPRLRSRPTENIPITGGVL